MTKIFNLKITWLPISHAFQPLAITAPQHVMADPPGGSWIIARKEFHDQIVGTLRDNEKALTMLAYYREDPTPFIAFIRNLASAWGALYENKSNTQLIQIITREISRRIRGDNTSALAAAFASFTFTRKQQYERRCDFLTENQLTPNHRINPSQVYAKDKLDTFFQKCLRSAYPPHGKWICESVDIHNLWDYHLRFDPKADNRLPRHEPVVIKSGRLERIIAADQSCIIRDPKTKEIVLIVLRNCVSDSALKWLDDIIGEATSTRRCIRVCAFHPTFTVRITEVF